MQEDKRLMVPRTARAEIIRCKYHAKESRYVIKHFPDHQLIILFCVECNPPMELARYKLAQEEAPSGNQHRILTAKTFGVPR